MDKQYNPKEVEGKIYKLWEESGFFNPDNLPDVQNRKPYCIIMPPPNANGALHTGHALFVTLEDIMTRYNRMRGAAALWLPGADHAGFETQVVFEKSLEKEGKTRFQFEREELYKMIWDFTQKNKVHMENQLRQLGASCDWSREKFTLDPEIIKIVYRTFKKMYGDGLVYRGTRVINWCTKHQTSLSDLEVSYENRRDKLIYIKYQFKDGDGHVVVATTRPETMLGDTAVAVNPSDERYKNFVGKILILPIMNREIPIVADEAVEKEFGTGAVKVTPAHDAVDFEISQRHGLPVIDVIGKDGKMTSQAGEFAGLKVAQAREKVVEKLKGIGAFEKEEDYEHSVALCYKCKNLIEPVVSEQWFVKTESLAKKAIEAVKNGEIKFHPEHYEKIFFNWMANIRDWNISRQIVWGIRIPAWFCGDCNNIMVSDGETPRECTKCHSKNISQDMDVFDTWFSSGQWPFATLRVNQPSDFEKFYPTSVMETAWDILFFWVARMIMLGTYCTGKIPFRDVVLHGLIRDKDRQKMSKSKGNVIDPLAVVEQYGADALRMSLVFGTSAGRDIPMSENKIVAQRKFANKIWNAARFSLENLNDFDPAGVKPVYTKEDEWILGELAQTAQKITKDLDSFQFHEAALSVYHFFWHSFCDKCIENVKERIKEPKSETDKKTAQFVLWKTLVDSLKLLHPFMPFVSEKIYQEIPHRPKIALIIEDWPE